ncbi:MAG TPA: GMC family oxidoreductase, partial [Pseudonocardia sp.]|nr:GMC family oxidoreductase [Pseudonocardia sp.]
MTIDPFDLLGGTAPQPVPESVEPGPDGVLRADIVIIGSGMGGSTLAHALRGSGARVLVVERGDFLPREIQNWSPEDVFAGGRYRNAESWLNAAGGTFSPGVHYYVGGNTKVYGAMLPRFRAEDFGVVDHPDGRSKAWPVSYAELEPYYAEAERLYRVHGAPGDPTDPWRSTDYPFPALAHDQPIADLAGALSAQGLRPFVMPAAVDYQPDGRCVLCRTCDGFPCLVDAKGDADVFALRPALASRSVGLLTRTFVERLVTSPDGGTVTEAHGRRDGRPVRIVADRFVVACGAANTAALLLRSADDQHPLGLANSSDQVGRNYMVHNSTFFVAVDPRRRNTTRFQKTLALNDWYLASPSTPFPLGNVQMLGKLQAPMLAGARRGVPTGVLRYMTDHSVDLYLTSEDLPDPANRITVRNGRIVVAWTPNNLGSHAQLVRRTTRAVRKAGYPLVFTERMGIATNSHMCGTAVMGEDPGSSVVDPTGKAHDLANLWIADSAVFPSSAAVNPALTIAAHALRLAAESGLCPTPSGQ